MIDAEKARTISGDDYYRAIFKSCMRDINANILSAAKKGVMFIQPTLSCIVQDKNLLANKTLQREIIKKLKSLGFGYDESSDVLSWDKRF